MRLCSRLLMVIAGTVMLTACSNCPPTGPSGAAAMASGTVAGESVAFHDFAPPPDTDSVDITVTWTPTSVELRLIQVDPTCDPTAGECRRLSDPAGPRPGSAGVINGYGSNQGPNAAARLRFMIQNLTADRGATYTMTMTPKRHGCDR